MTRCSGSGGHALNHDADQFGAGAEVEPDVACAGSSASASASASEKATSVPPSSSRRGGAVEREARAGEEPPCPDDVGPGAVVICCR